MDDQQLLNVLTQEGVLLNVSVRYWRGRKKLKAEDIAGVLTGFVPLSKLMSEQIKRLRDWAKGRARLATSSSVQESDLRRIAA